MSDVRPYGRLHEYVNVLAAFCCLLWFFAGTAAAGQQARTIVAFGDSLTAGYGLAQKDAFPNQLERALNANGHKVTIRNAGVSGDTSSGGLARFDWAIGGDVDLVILELGANDALRGVNPDVTRSNLLEILNRLKAKNIPVLFTGMRAPPNYGSDYQDEFDGLYPDLAKRLDVAFYPFFLDGVAAQAALNQSDGIHPNADGVAVIVERILPHVESLLKSID